MRLNRYLSACGLGSRRGSEALIKEGQVTINGEVCLNLGTVVTDKDEVVVHGKKIRPNKGVVIVLHKPRGFVCTRRDERDRETLYTLLPTKFVTLHHVGRLDKESEGLILLTNKGDLSHQLLHPSKGVEKEYEVVIEEKFNPDDLAKLIKGFHMPEGGTAKAERAWMIGDYKIGVVLKQGLKRQIRDMLYFLGHEVRRLIRVRIGNLSIKGLPEGAWKELTDHDVETLLLNPQTKDRPKLSKPRTASVKRNAAKRASRSTDAGEDGDKDKEKAKPKAEARGGKREREHERERAPERDRDRDRDRTSDRGKADSGAGTGAVKKKSGNPFSGKAPFTGSSRSGSDFDFDAAGGRRAPSKRSTGGGAGGRGGKGGKRPGSGFGGGGGFSKGGGRGAPRGRK